MLTRVLRKLFYAARLFKVGGPRVFWHQLKRQIYSRDTLFGLEKTWNADGAQVSSRLQYVLSKASEEDMAEVLSRAKTESKQAAHELVERKWFYDCGFHDCYVARTVDTGEPCCLAWLVSAEDNDVVTQGFGSRLPALKKDELLLENCYTFEKYRGKNLMPAVVLDLWKMAGGHGFRRLITYVRQDNTASLKVFEKLAFREFEKIPELKFLFFTGRKHG
ncbi:MAG: hypothetical protein A2144_03455 [Chloroflexi bacterium RBG_16_50_9]|nr:MAG: hypothetical protein A2144_03455 [Chloroflexi bacterium RBG_16_50_9]